MRLTGNEMRRPKFRSVRATVAWSCDGAGEGYAMYRFAIKGSTSKGRVITCYVTAATKEQALDLGFDSMGLLAICSCRKVSSKPLKG